MCRRWNTWRYRRTGKEKLIVHPPSHRPPSSVLSFGGYFSLWSMKRPSWSRNLSCRTYVSSPALWSHRILYHLSARLGSATSSTTWNDNRAPFGPVREKNYICSCSRCAELSGLSPKTFFEHTIYVRWYHDRPGNIQNSLREPRSTKKSVAESAPQDNDEIWFVHSLKPKVNQNSCPCFLWTQYLCQQWTALFGVPSQLSISGMLKNERTKKSPRVMRRWLSIGNEIHRVLMAL
jgi:hypothetical protein